MTDAVRNYSIIGIHGLRPKPPMDVLRAGWLSALREGLERNDQLPIQANDLAFELVYWADWMGEEPYAAGMDPEPYIEADGEGPLPRYSDRLIGPLIDPFIAKAFDLADIAHKPWESISRHIRVDKATAMFLKFHFEDLSTYYENEAKRRFLRGKLRDALLAQKGKRIMLIAHSMGSIVAYDVLRALGEDNPDFEVSHFVTLGSPLALPHVLKKIRSENAAVYIPSVVRRWTNLADRRDRVAVHVNLAKSFQANGTDVTVDDKLVINGYRPPKKDPTHHTIYGYLRAPEFTELVRGAFF